MVHVACCWAHLLLLFFSPPTTSSSDPAALKPQQPHPSPVAQKKRVDLILLQPGTKTSGSDDDGDRNPELTSSAVSPSGHRTTRSSSTVPLFPSFPGPNPIPADPSSSLSRDSSSFSSSAGPTRSSSANAEAGASVVPVDTVGSCLCTHSASSLPSRACVVFPFPSTDSCGSPVSSNPADEQGRRAPVAWTQPRDTAENDRQTFCSSSSSSGSSCHGESSSSVPFASSSLEQNPHECSSLPHDAIRYEGPADHSSRLSSSSSDHEEKRLLSAPTDSSLSASSSSRIIPAAVAREEASCLPLDPSFSDEAVGGTSASRPPRPTITTYETPGIPGGLLSCSSSMSLSAPPPSPAPPAFCCEPSRHREQHVIKPLLAAASAAGMSCAFGSPIGGVLFALEEMGASDLPASCLWLCCCACVSASIVLQILNPESRTSSFTLFSAHNNGGILPFSWWKESVALFRTFDLIELLPFAFLGLVGGLIGPAFIWMALKAGKLRKKRMCRSKAGKGQEGGSPSRRTNEKENAPDGLSRGVCEVEPRLSKTAEERGGALGGGAESAEGRSAEQRRHEEGEVEREGGHATAEPNGAPGQAGGGQRERLGPRAFLAREEEQGSDGDRSEKGFLPWVLGWSREHLLQGGPVVDCAVVAACTAVVNFILPMAGASSNDLLGKKETFRTAENSLLQ